MDEATIKALVEQLDTADENARYAVWQRLGPMREELVPALVEFYSRARKWQCRKSIVFNLHPYSRNRRTGDQVFRLGLAACTDRATNVRYWACSLLAYSGRRAAIPKLKQLLTHPDPLTVADARAAINAIRWCSYKLYCARTWWEWLELQSVRFEVSGAGQPLPWWKQVLDWLDRHK